MDVRYDPGFPPPEQLTAPLESRERSRPLSNLATFTSVDLATYRARNAALPFAGVISLYRMATLGIILSLLWNARYAPAMYGLYAAVPMTDEFFPSLFSSSASLAIFYCAPIILGTLAIFSRNAILLRTLAIITTGCLFGLCIHQCSYNDVTYLTSFWVSMWCTWFAFKLNTPKKVLIAQAQRFAILVLSLIFLGGAVGKWTPEYWSGEVLNQIYFVNRDYWFFNLLRDSLSPDSLRGFATYYSRMVVVTESACIFLWMLPTRLAGGIAISVLLGICIFSNVHLFSVMFCLLGLALVALHDPAKAA